MTSTSLMPGDFCLNCPVIENEYGSWLSRFYSRAENSRRGMRLMIYGRLDDEYP
jgi:hypothetical protein